MNTERLQSDAPAAPVVEVKHCCEEMAFLVEFEFITIWNGEPFALLVDRLDLHEKVWFKFCPFCGTAVRDRTR